MSRRCQSEYRLAVSCLVSASGYTLRTFLCASQSFRYTTWGRNHRLIFSRVLHFL
jgi:hypothetical protein